MAALQLIVVLSRRSSPVHHPVCKFVFCEAGDFDPLPPPLPRFHYFHFGSWCVTEAAEKGKCAAILCDRLLVPVQLTTAR